MPFVRPIVGPIVLGLIANILGPSGGEPNMIADIGFMDNAMPAGVSLTRNTPGWYCNNAGIWKQAAANVPRFHHDPNTQTARNYALNPSFDGAADGVTPDRMQVSSIVNGITVRCLRKQTIIDPTYGEIRGAVWRVSGNATTGGTISWSFNDLLPVLQGQRGLGMIYCTRLSGSIANGFGSALWNENGRQADGTTASGDNGSTSMVSCFTGTPNNLLRYLTGRTASDATTAFMRFYITMQFVAGANMDFEVFIGGPMFENRPSSQYVGCTYPQAGVQEISGNATRLGMMSELAATNIALWCRDLTNAIWVPSGITPALDQAGIDEVANSCSSLTCATANGTILQSISSASNSIRSLNFFVRRRVGTGTVKFTVNGGTGWVDITSQLVPGKFVRIDSTMTYTNPNIGFQLGTVGDVVDIDFVQSELGCASSPIYTTNAQISRNPETPIYLQNMSMTACTIAVQCYIPPWANPSRKYHGYGGIQQGSAGTNSFGIQTRDFTNVPALAGTIGQTALTGVANLVTNAVNKLVYGFDLGSGVTAVALNGAAPVKGTCNVGGTFTADRITPGWNQPYGAMDGCIQRMRVWDGLFDDASLQTLAT